MKLLANSLAAFGLIVALSTLGCDGKSEPDFSTLTRSQKVKRLSRDVDQKVFKNFPPEVIGFVKAIKLDVYAETALRVINEDVDAIVAITETSCEKSDLQSVSNLLDSYKDFPDQLAELMRESWAAVEASGLKNEILALLANEDLIEESRNRIQREISGERVKPLTLEHDALRNLDRDKLMALAASIGEAFKKYEEKLAENERAFRAKSANNGRLSQTCQSATNPSAEKTISRIKEEFSKS
jgi:hypothetical protein